MVHSLSALQLKKRELGGWRIFEDPSDDPDFDCLFVAPSSSASVVGNPSREQLPVDCRDTEGKGCMARPEPFDFRDPDDAIASFRHQQRRIGTDIAEALNDHSGLFRAQP